MKRWLPVPFIGRVARGLLALLRELGDENAYARHLAVHHREHSADEWRRFSDKRLRQKYQQGRCC